MDLDDLKTQMKAVITKLGNEYSLMRTNRVQPSILHGIKVSIFGYQSAINSLAVISTQGRDIIVTPFDPSNLKEISKEIEKSPLGIQPSIEDKRIRVSIPEMSQDLRKAISKQAKSKAEHSKITIRDLRRRANEEIKKQKTSGEISEDDMHKQEKMVQKITDECCREVDAAYEQKEKDLTSR